MEPDSFLSMPRWRILELIAQRPSSPLEISKELHTSVAYVSQQLKLLEAAGFVAKTRTGYAEKGQPRNIYSLTNEMLYLAVLTKEFPSKKLMILQDYQITVLRIWLLDNPKIKRPLEKLYWLIEEELQEIQGIFVSTAKENEVFVVTDSKKIKQKIEQFTKENKDTIRVQVVPIAESKKLQKNETATIFTSSSSVGGKMKGGGE